MRRMLTAIVSDLHLGSSADTDVARRPRALARLAEALEPADRVVVLGDLLELRERPDREVLELATPALTALGEASAGGELVICPGNHDHALVAPALEQAALDGDGSLGPEGTYDAGAGELSRRVAALMPDTEVTLAYPGIRIREDVYATHGHYLDLHLTVPRVECVLASALQRYGGNGRARTAAEHEAALTPLYAFAHTIAQRSRAAAITEGGAITRRIWRQASGGRRSLAGFALGRVAIPAGVGAINLLGIGPFRSDISAIELRRAGLRAMGDVVDGLGVRAEHVIFGHTHRAGPFEGEIEGWHLAGGTRLHNTGCWVYEKVFVDPERAGGPYWPGSVTLVRDEGPPELTNVLGPDDLEG
jgi:calcineurin-like phosphoesterase family protein